MAVLAISCSSEKDRHFSFSGKTHDLEDGTVLYLARTLDDVLIDSAIVKDNMFEFSAELKDAPLNAMVRTANYSHFRMLWLENNPMTFDASKTDFRNAVVTGSHTEELSYAFQKSIEPLIMDRSKNAERRALEVAFVRDNATSIVSAETLSIYATQWGKEQTQMLYNKLSEDVKTTPYGKKVARYLELNKEIKVGHRFVDFEMEGEDGGTKRLSDVKGKVVLLEFWASWCAPCRKENPNLVATYNRFHTDGFEIFSVSLDMDKESWLAAIEHDKLGEWDHVFDAKGPEADVVIMYGISGIPDNFLFDENGTIIARNLRGIELDETLAEMLSSD